MSKSCSCNKVSGVELVNDRIVIDASITDAVIAPLAAGVGFLGANAATIKINEMMVKNGGQALSPNLTGATKIGLGVGTGYLGYRYAPEDFKVLVISAGLGMCIAGKMDIARENLPEKTKQLVGLAGISGVNALLLNSSTQIRQKEGVLIEEQVLVAA